jgi:hypothetical protein
VAANCGAILPFQAGLSHLAGARMVPLTFAGLSRPRLYVRDYAIGGGADFLPRI